MILARNSITLHHLRDITTVVWYYKLQASTASPPTKPTTETPSGWSTTEPSYTEGSTNSLYVVQKTTFSDGSFEYSDVSLSSSYEAAKAAYNKSVQAQTTANAAQESVDNLEIGGRNLILDTATERISPASANNSAYVAPVPIMSDYASGILNNRDDYFTYSFDYEVTGNEASEAYIYVQIRGGTVPSASDGYYSYVLENPTGKHCCTFKLTEAQATGTYTGCGIRLRYATDGAILRVWNIKLERGTRATDWTPAPEDVQAGIDTALSQSIEYIVGTQSAATGSWKGETADSELRDGKTIMYKLPYAGSGNASLQLTLPDGTLTDNLPIYMLHSTTSNNASLTRVTTHYPAGSVIEMTYDSTDNCWKTTGYNANINNVDRTQYGVAFAASASISAGRIAVLGTDGKLHLLNTSAFDAKCPPLYVATAYSAANVTSEATRQTNYSYWGTAFNLTNTHAITGAVAGKPVYIVGTMSGDVFTPATAVLTCTEPTTDDGLLYMRLGRMSTTSNAVLEMDHPIYVYYDGAFRKLSEAEEMKAAKVADNYLSSDNTGIMVADMTDGNTYTPSNVPSGTKNTFINEDSFQVRDGTDVLASFGEETQIGKDDANHLDIDATGIQGVNEDGVTIFNMQMDGAGRVMSRLKNYTRDPVTQDLPHVEIRTTSSLTDPLLLNEPPSEPMADSRSVGLVWAWEIVRSSDDGLVVHTQMLSRFRKGTPLTDTRDIEYEGVNYGTVQIYYDGDYTFSVNGYLSASAVSAGYFIDVIGLNYIYTIILRDPVFTFGTRRTSDAGRFSTVIGEELSAAYAYQFACGKYNTDNPDYVFMVGNGSETDGESNAFAVTWDGNQLLALDETATSGTDAELYSAITSLGWESEVLV